MHYKVSARFRSATATEFQRKLHDGSVLSQKPDGEEIVASMQRAVVTDDGQIQWCEVCYCETPLYHERKTVYDQHFDQFKTEVIDRYESYEGRPFMDYLNEIVAQNE